MKLRELRGFICFWNIYLERTCVFLMLQYPEHLSGLCHFCHWGPYTPVKQKWIKMVREWGQIIDLSRSFAVISLIFATMICLGSKNLEARKYIQNVRSSSLITPIHHNHHFQNIHEVNQKGCTKQSSLHLHIKIHWESYSKVLCVREQFLFDTWPFFGNFSNLKRGNSKKS